MNFSKLKSMFLTAFAALGFMAFSASSQAAILALDIAPIETDVQATVTNVTPAVISIMAVVLGVTIGIKLVKKLITSGA